MGRNDRILQAEYLFLVIAFVLRYIQVLTFTDSVAKNDSWLVIIAGFILSIPFILVYTALAKRFPSKTLLEIYRTVFGKVAGTVLSLLYIAYFLVILSHFLNDVSEYYTQFVQTETPPLLFILIFILASAIVLKAGIQYLVKMSLIIAIIALSTLILTFLLLLGKMDFSNFLPILRQEPDVYLKSVPQFVLVQGTHILYIFMLLPKLQSTKKLTKLTLIGVAIGMFGILLASVRNTAVLDSSAFFMNSASFSSARIIAIGDVFTRVDFAISLNITFLTFLNTCVLYYAAVKGISELFKAKSIQWFIIPAGVISVILAMTLFNSSLEHIEFAKKYNVPVYSVFHFVIPPAALLTAKLRKMHEGLEKK